MKTQNIVVVGIGSMGRGDAAFGIEVVRQLAKRALPKGVTVTEYDPQGNDVARLLMRDHKTVVFVGTSRRGAEPGTLSLIEPNLSSTESTSGTEAPESPLDLETLLQRITAAGWQANRVLAVACEPKTLEASGGDAAATTLSQPVQAAAIEAVNLIESLVAVLLLPTAWGSRGRRRTLRAPGTAA